MNNNFIDENEIMLRQVHPKFIENDRVTSQAFRPTQKDDKKLSVSRDSLTNAKDSFDLYTAKRELSSVGVWGVTIAEIKENSDLSVKSDPLTDPVIDKAHALVDFSKLESDAKIRKAADKLVSKARNRGVLYKPEQKIEGEG